MSKRRASSAPPMEADGGDETSRDQDVPEDKEHLRFQDEFSDEFESDSDQDQQHEETDQPSDQTSRPESSQPSRHTASSATAATDDGVHASTSGRLWRPGDTLEPGEQLQVDNSAYEMLHRMQVEWPCLTFGFATDPTAGQSTAYPLTAYAVMGTQAERSSQNKLLVLKVSNLCRTNRDDDSDDSSDDDSDDEASSDPMMQSLGVAHPGTVNRLKLMPQAPHVCATWSDQPAVHLWDLSTQLTNLRAPGRAPGPPSQQPVFSYGGHADEGFALDFSPVQQGSLATGDCAGSLRLWRAASSGGSGWAVEPAPLVGHVGSVEDVQWSPVEANVLMSCGVDATLRVWDVRNAAKAGAAITADEGHKEDINVIGWNRLVNYLVVSGADDGTFRVWDLRSIRGGEPVARFDWHKGPITSVEWSPHESSTLAVSGDDDQLTLWDLALEDDPEAERAIEGRDDLADIPPQLFFVHQGQHHMKELHWHAQLPGVLASTAEDSVHVWKPANIGDGAAST